MDPSPADEPEQEPRRFISAEKVELEVALGDRRAAIEALTHTALWLAGALFLINGGALIAALAMPTLTVTALLEPTEWFQLGLIGAVFVGWFGFWLAMERLATSNIILGRWPRSMERRARQLRHLSLFSVGLFSTVSFIAFMVGSYALRDALVGAAAIQTEKAGQSGSVSVL